jgi:hypothetical protein
VPSLGVQVNETCNGADPAVGDAVPETDIPTSPVTLIVELVHVPTFDIVSVTVSVAVYVPGAEYT